MNQRERIMWHLSLAADHGNGVCATRFLEQRIPRAAARINELRNNGAPIVTEPCQDETHRHKTSQVQYRLIRKETNGG